MTGHVLTIEVTECPASWPFERRWSYDRLTVPATTAYADFCALLTERGEDFDADPETPDALVLVWRRVHEGVAWVERHEFTAVVSS